jgi:hypothetical protein
MQPSTPSLAAERVNNSRASAVVVGRLTWIRFAGDIGVITTPAVPILLIAAMVAVAGGACGVLALIPAEVATRASAAAVLHAG